jgi:hypothetical protein
VPVYKTTRRQNTEVYPKTCPTRLHCIYVQLLVQHGEYYEICQGHSTLYNVPADLPDRTAVNLSHTRIPARAKLNWTIFDGSQKLQLFFPQTYLQKTSINNHYTNLDHHHLTGTWTDSTWQKRYVELLNISSFTSETQIPAFLPWLEVVFRNYSLWFHHNANSGHSCTRWKPQSHDPSALRLGNRIRYPLNRRLDGPKSKSGYSWNYKASCPCRDSSTGPSNL